MTPLLEAVQAQDLKKVKALLDAGADPNENNKAAMAEATRIPSTKILHELLEVGGGTNINGSEELLLIGLATKNWKALRILADWGASPKELPLKQWGAYEDCMDKMDRSRPPGQEGLMDAIRRGDVQRATRCIKSEGVEINGRNKEKRTPLREAISSNQPEMVTLLLKHGAKLENRSPNWLTALHEAITLIATFPHQTKVEMVEHLLKAGANANGDSIRAGLTPLHSAARRGLDNVCRLLIAYGANPGEIDRTGKTPAEVGCKAAIENAVAMRANKKTIKAIRAFNPKWPEPEI